MNKQISQQLDEATARIDSMIHIGGMVTDSDSLPDPLSEFLVEEESTTVAECFPEMDERTWEDIEDGDLSAFCSWVHRNKKLGFLVRFATPVMEHHGVIGSSYSWGYYGMHWVYGETLEEAVQKGLQWVASRRAKEAGKAGLEP